MNWRSALRGIQVSHLWWLMPLILVGPPLWYATIYVPRQQAYFTDRNFRLLNGMGENLKSRVENSVTALKNQMSTPKWHTNDVEEIQANMALIPGLELVGKPVVTYMAAGTPSNSVQVSFAAETGVRFDGAAVVTNKGGARYVALQAKRSFANLLGAREEFDALLLADEQKNVLFKQSAAGWNALQLNELTDTAGGVMKTNLERKISTAKDVNCAGVTYRMFAHPVIVTAGMANESGTTFWLCGMVELKRFLAESTAISHRRLTLFGFLALGVMTTTPFLKLRLMGRRAPLRPKDVLLFAAATIGAAGVMTLLALDFFSYVRTDKKFDDDLRTFSANIADHFSEELKHIAKQLKDFENPPERNAIKDERPLPDGSGRTYLAYALDYPEVVSNITHAPYPFFEMVGWVAASGEQQRKWTVKPMPTPFIDVKAREYFSDALAVRHSPYECLVDGDTLWAQPIVSWNTGESSMIVAVPQTNDVLTMDCKLLSLIRPVLPPGFGFAIVGPNGRTLLHSDPSRNQQEDILQECNNHPMLRSALLGGQHEPFNVTYRGLAHTLCARPLPHTPWTLVAFRDATGLNLANFDITFIGVCLYGTYLAALLLVVGASRSFSRKATQWLWPDPLRLREHMRVFWVNLALAVVMSGLISFSTELAISPLSLTLFSIVSGVGGFLIARCLGGRTTESAAPLQSTLGSNWRYVLMPASLLLVIGALPAFGFFKVAYDFRVDIMLAEGQLRMGKALLERKSRVENEYRGLFPGSSRYEAWIQRRMQGGTPERHPLDVYVDSFFGTSLLGHSCPAASENRIESFFERNILETLRPLHYRTMSTAQGVFCKAAVDTNAWVFAHNPGRSYLIPSPDLELPFLVSAIPALNFHKSAGGRVILILIALGAYCIARFGARHLFALGVRAKPMRDAGSALPAQDRLILTPVGRDPSHPWLQDSRMEQLDMTRLDEWKPRLAEIAAGEPDQVLVIQCLEHKWEDPESNRVKLEIFEALTRSGRVIAAVSAVEPSNFRFWQAGAAEEARKQGEVQLARWIKIFEPFARDYGKQAELGISNSSHRAVWATCSREERLALFEVARYGFINCKNPELPGLLERRLIVRNPDLQTADGGFARFVLKMFRPEDLPQDQQEEAPSAWTKLKKPLWVVLICFALFMFITQRELFNATTTALTAFLAVIPTMLKFLETLQRQKA